MERMVAWNGRAELKAQFLELAAEHERLEAGMPVGLVRGTYWQGNGDGRGCAVGCFVHDAKKLGLVPQDIGDGNHAAYEALGIPKLIGLMVDGIYERLPEEISWKWQSRYLAAIEVGADLAMVWPGVWVELVEDQKWGLLTFEHELKPVSEALQRSAQLMKRRIAGDEPERAEWFSLDINDPVTLRALRDLSDLRDLRALSDLRDLRDLRDLSDLRALSDLSDLRALRALSALSDLSALRDLRDLREKIEERATWHADILVAELQRAPVPANV